ncbi:unnamed protein product, partial [Bubo scandiacus]
LRRMMRALSTFGDPDDGAEHTLRQLAEGTRLGGEAPAAESCVANQRDLDRLEKGAARCFLSLKKGKREEQSPGPGEEQAPGAV